MRTILLFVLAMLAVYLFRRALHKPRPGRESDAKRDAGGERMVACEYCGLHVPESETVRAEEAVFCCREHRRLHRDENA